MKLNYKKLFLILLCGIAIGLGCFASAISLLLEDKTLAYFLLFTTYFTGIYFVKMRHKYDLFIK